MSKTRVFIGLPSLMQQHWGLLRQMFAYATRQDYELQIGWATERRHHDHARNNLAQEFLKGTCEWMLMIDADVEPNPNLLDLTKHGKPIIAALVFCWIKDKLLPSIWQRAPCEQCQCREIWDKTGKLHDPSQYAYDGPWLLRWNPFRNTFQKFYSRETHRFAEKLQCRCQGSGLDPWVFRVAENIADPQPPIKVDAVGSAAMMIRREVFEKVEFPWFSFLYRPDRSILLTEDLYACWKATQFGFEIYADQLMACSHLKTVDLLQIHNYCGQIYEQGVKDGMERAAQAKSETPQLIRPPTEKELMELARN